MDKVCDYRIEVWGKVDAAVLNVMSPVEIQVEEAGTAVSRLTIRTDQSGLIGLLRHLHSLGFLLLAISRSGYRISGSIRQRVWAWFRNPKS